MNKRKVISILPFFLLLPCCSQRHTEYRTALLGARPTKLDPAGVPEYAELTLMSQICGRLVSLNGNLDLEGDIAESWSVDSAGKIYTFQLKPNRHFSDGDLVRADDVVFTLKRISDSAISSVAGWMDEVASEEAFSKTSIQITLSRPNPRFLYKLAHPRFCILEKQAPFSVVAGITVPNSSGAYDVIPSSEGDVRLQVTHDYASRAIEKSISVRFLRQQDAIAAFRSGELEDLSFYLLGSDELKDLPDADLVTYPIHWTWMLSLNPKKDVFKEAEVRRRFLSGIDVRKLRQRWGATGDWELSVVPEGMVGYIAMRQEDVLPQSSTERLTCKKPLDIIVISGVERETRLKQGLEDVVRDGTGCKNIVRVLPMDEYSRLLASGSADIYIQAMDSISPDPLTFYDNYIEGHADNALYSRDSALAQTYNSLYLKPFHLRSSEDYAVIQRAFFSEAFGLPIGNPQYTFAYKHSVKHKRMNPFGMLFNRWFEIGR